MATTDCRSFREALLGYLGHELEVNAFENQYVVTLPLKTLDDRFLDVYIEEHPPDYLVVHDGGPDHNGAFCSRNPSEQYERRIV